MKDKIKDLMIVLDKEGKITSLSKEVSMAVIKEIREKMEVYKIEHEQKRNKSEAETSKIFIS